MEKVFVFPNPIRQSVLESAPMVLEALKRHGFTALMPTEFDGRFDQYCVQYLTQEEALCRCDFVLVIGGDGTILHMAFEAAKHHKPILGVNMGNMGFMSELELTELELLKKIAEGDFVLDRRMMINAELQNTEGEVIFTATGLNDAIVMKEEVSKTVKLAVSVDGKKVMNFSGDGVIVSTPTGSTAYSLSAGGPIMEPSSPCMAVTPVCPHALGIKSFVVPSGSAVSITPPEQDNQLRLSVDGYQNHSVGHNQTVTIRKSSYEVCLVRLKGLGFYEIINQKLNERY